MRISQSRREFLRHTAGLGAAAGIGLLPTSPGTAQPRSQPDPLFKISLAQWSLHRTLFDGDLDNLDFAPYTRQEFGIEAVEYVNQFFMDKARDRSYLREMKKRADGEGVRSLLIMIDQEGWIGDPDDEKRTQTIENHKKWVEAADFLGCHSIRVNALSNGSYEEQKKLVTDGLRRLTEFAAQADLNVLVENHGGQSSIGYWLAEVMNNVDHPRCGTLPDFGNFQIGSALWHDDINVWYDYYRGVEEIVPYAEAMSAKTYDFDENGNETTLNYERLIRIITDHGYNGYLGIEYEGDNLSEAEGIKQSKKMLERVREQFS